MSNPATTQFFEGLRSSRLLDDARLAELRSRPEAEWGDVVGLAQYAQERGWLTAYQSHELEEGRGDKLVVGGYRISDKLDDGPAGVAYKATHPSLQQPVWLRILRPDWLAPADNAADYIARTQAATLVLSPHLATVLDVGTQAGAPYVVQEYVDGSDLFRLVNEMGALPAGVACEYIRQATAALKAAHEKGVAHGDVSAYTLVISPVDRDLGSIRPRSGASVKVVELGLTPQRPAIHELQYGQSDKLGHVAFLPPERLTNGGQTAAGDLYGVGATLYYLLTTKPPVAGDNPVEVLLNLQQVEPTPLETLRPDVPIAVSFLVKNLLNRDPAFRPTAASVIDNLEPYCDPSAKPAPTHAPVPLLASETFTLPGMPAAVPVATDLDRPAPANEPFAEALPSESSVALGAVPDQPVVEPMSERSLPQVEPMEGSSSDHLGSFGHTEMGADRPRAPRPKAPMSGKNKAMIIGGLCLHLIATCMCLSFFGIIPNPFASKPTQDTTPKVEKKDKDKKKGATH